MNKAFPSVSTVSTNEAEAGSIVNISRSLHSVLALVTDQSINGTRSVVWLNSISQDRPSVLLMENWRNEENALRYNDSVHFDLGMTEEEIDPKGRNSWETPGVIVSIGDELFIRAAPYDDFHGQYRLVNIRTGSIFPDRPPQSYVVILVVATFTQRFHNRSISNAHGFSDKVGS